MFTPRTMSSSKIRTTIWLLKNKGGRKGFRIYLIWPMDPGIIKNLHKLICTNRILL